MLTVKKSLSLVLVLAILATVLCAAPAWAVSPDTQTVSGFEEISISRQDTSATADSAPSLAEGNHVLWIDRIAQLPDYARDFYSWLTDNATATGCLADPTKGTQVGSDYLYLAASQTQSTGFTYSGSQTPAEAAKDAAVALAYPQFQIIMSYLSECYNAFHRDCPEVFWLSGASRYSWSVNYGYTYRDGAGTVTYTMNVYFSLKTSDFDIRNEKYQDLDVLTEAIAQCQADADRILADCPTDAPVYEQVRYLNRVLTQTNSYNSGITTAEDMDPWGCISALSGRVGTEGPVCEGYSKAFKVLCDRLGIGCVLVEGDAKSNVDDIPGAHMWNYVCVDGQWYAVDVTWNDPVVVGTQAQAVSGYEREDWLLLGSETQVSEGLSFLESHPVTNVVSPGGLDFNNGPVLAETAYEPAENYMDIAPYRGEVYTAPVKDGYVFAGWYADADLTQPISPETVSGWAYARFLNEDTLTVKYQLTNGTTAQSASTDLRVLTAVDGLGYRSVGFEVALLGSVQTLSSHTVYEQVRAGSTLISNAAALFGKDAQYFVTYTLLGIPQRAYDATFTVTAYWETMDGTVVQGASRSFAISDTF